MLIVVHVRRLEFAERRGRVPGGQGAIRKRTEPKGVSPSGNWFHLRGCKTP
jgi:hypothetical protein